MTHYRSTKLAAGGLAAFKSGLDRKAGLATPKVGAARRNNALASGL